MECGQVARVNVVGVVGVGVAPAGSVSSASPSPSTPRAMDIQPVYLQTKGPGNDGNKAKKKKHLKYDCSVRKGKWLCFPLLNTTHYSYSFALY